MDLDASACYRALQTRDARFDGRFFVAVRSTGVYCRPVCPARTPRLENCLFLPCAAAAQEAGYRPCLRCRPEASPGTPAWHGTSATVSRALRLIAQGALDEGTVDELATRLGVGERHLRRLFLEHLGASPGAVAQTRRLLFAKKLIDETHLPMSEIAFAAGFASIRRFNAAVRKAWDRPPRDLRRGRRSRLPATSIDAATGPGGALLRLRLPFRPPFDWQALAGFLALRAIPGVERVSNDGYARSFRLGDAAGIVEVAPAPGENHLVAAIRLSGPAAIIRLSERLRLLFDLSADPERIAAQLVRDPALRSRLRAHPGLRVPGAWDGFELAVRAILGQQVSVRGATTLAGRIARVYGDPLPAACHPDDEDAPTRLFPPAEALVDLDPAAVGLTRARAAAIRGVARAVAGGDLDLDASPGLEETVERLAALPGVGDWTAQYIAMRALHEPDAFPASDLGLRKALGAGGRPASTLETASRAESWRPWRAYAALHLWTDAPARQKRSTPARRPRGGANPKRRVTR